MRNVRHQYFYRTPSTGILALLFLLILGVGFRFQASAQGEINVRIGGPTGASIFTGCSYYLGVFNVNDVSTVTLYIENQSATEDLTLAGFNNIFNPAEMDVTITANDCPPILPPGGNCSITLTLAPHISAVMEDTLNINNSDPDEGLYQIRISLTTFDPSMVGKKLILNEVSQGNGGVQEFVEFLVVGRPGTCQDVRGWLFDDNSGRPGGPGVCGTGPSGAGIASGHARLAQHSQWEFTPVGSLIVIYNHNDRNFRMPADDPTDANNDNAYIIPISDNTLLDKYPLCPSATLAGCNEYNCAVGVNNIWDFLGMANAGDMFQLIDPADLTNFHHSVAWGSLTGTGSTVFFAGSAANKTIQFVNRVSDDAFLQANWRYETVTNAMPNGDSPGLPNSVKNQRWMESVRFKSYGCINNKASTPNPNDSCVVFLTTNATENVIAYEWDFDNDGTTDRTTTTPYTNFRFNSNGVYDIGLKLITGTPCEQTQTITIECYTFAAFSEVFYVKYDPVRRHAILNWATDNPKAESFIIERSSNGRDFQTIHRFTAEKDPHRNVRYFDYYDYEVPFVADKVFYRLSYVEKAGASHTFPIRQLQVSRPQLLRLFPNPTSAELNISVPEEILHCQVYDATGRIVFQYTPNPNNTGTAVLPTQNLPDGVYWLWLQGSRKNYYERWVKM